MYRSVEESGRIKQIVLIGVLLCVLFLVKFPGQWTADEDFWSLAMNVGHFFIFAGLAFYFRFLKPLFPRLKGDFNRATAAALGGLVILIELIQPLFGRSASWEDLINGLLGIGSALIAGQLFSGRAGRRQWTYFAAANLLVLAAISYPWALEALSICWRKQNFPALGSFESEHEFNLWRAEDTGEVRTIHIERSTEQVRHGTYSLRVRSALPAGRVAVKYNAGDMDWSSQRSLVFDIYNPGDAVDLNVRIDGDGDSTDFFSRFNRTISLTRGWNQIEIAVAEIAAPDSGAAFSIKSVRRMILFADLPDARSLFIDHVRLQS